MDFQKYLTDKMLLFVLVWCKMEIKEFEQQSPFCGERWWHKANGKILHLKNQQSINQTNKHRTVLNILFKELNRAPHEKMTKLTGAQ